MTDASSMHEAGHPNGFSGTTQKDRVGREAGEVFRMRETHIYLWLIHADVWLKPSQYCKLIILP